MPKHRVGLHEVSYEFLSKAEARKPHPPQPMRSGNSKGPIKMWICAQAHCGEVEYTYTSHETPTCFGGLAWSFTTASGFDPRIHSPKAF